MEMIFYYLPQLIKADQRLFHAADANLDGVLDREEYRKFCTPEEYVDMFPVLIQNTLEEKDRNKDGFIDFEEFIGNAGTVGGPLFYLHTYTFE